MSVNTSTFPASNWDGTSLNRFDRLVSKKPDYEDWDQATAEIIAIQTELRKQKFINLANKNAGTVVPGTPVYVLANHLGFDKADANGTTVIRQCIGLVTASVLANALVDVCKVGPMTLTTAEWDAAAGTTGGLTAGTEYYVSGAVGVITATRPATIGDNITSVGIALSSTVLDVNVKHIGVSA